jgi:hypothetical protein
LLFSFERLHLLFSSDLSVWFDVTFFSSTFVWDSVPLVSSSVFFLNQDPSVSKEMIQRKIGWTDQRTCCKIPVTIELVAYENWGSKQLNPFDYYISIIALDSNLPWMV